MFLNDKKYYLLFTLLFLMSVIGRAQLGGLGGPLLSITFGEAPTDRITVAGLPLQIGHTEFQYTDNICPPEGMYTVVNGAPQSCDDSSLIDLYADNTPLPDNNGYMMVLNDVARSTPKILFEHTIMPCRNVDYQFSAAFINLDKPNSARCKRFSNFILEVRDATGVLIGTTTTGDMQFAINSFGWHFTVPYINFRLSENNALPVTVRIIDQAKALSGCHNFVAIDDIKVAVTGAEANIVFENTTLGHWVKSSCFQDNASFTMFGTVASNFSNPAVQWEQSTDNGITWGDIPGASGYTLTQNFPVADTFLFRLRASDLSLISSPGCGVSSDVLRVEVDGIPPVHNATNNTPVCAGNEIKFNAEGGASFEWHGPNGFYDNVKFPGIYRSELNDSGWYYTTIKTAGGCVVMDSTYVKVIGTDVRPGPDTAICAGSTVMLHSNEAVTYTWVPSTGLSDIASRQPLAAPKETTVYTLTVTDSYGCTGSGEVTVAVKNKIPVTAAISSSKYVCRLIDSLLFVNKGTGVIDKWSWDFGDGRMSTEQSPPVLYYSNVSTAINSYTVQLLVTDTAGCSAEAYQTLSVEDMCNLAVPTAFTPNGDGINDYFWPLNAFKTGDITFTVFNRKGIRIFETKQWPDKWDGTYKGEPQDAGTYVWVFTYTDTLGKKQVLKGSVVLLR